MDNFINNTIIGIAGAAIATKIFFLILTICVIWLLIKSAVKHGVLEALEEYYQNKHD